MRRAILGARRRLGLLLLATAANCLLAGAPTAFPQPAEPGLLCRQAIRQAEAGSGLPTNLLTGIARVESGRADPTTGRFHPWPWTINAEGRGYFLDSKTDAIAFARALQARGVRSFDAGCMQVNLMHHADAFQSLEEAFDPLANVRYAIKFLTQLREKTGSWETASSWYHSANPELGMPYRSQVASAMAVEANVASTYANLPAIPATASSGILPGLRSMPSGPGTVMLLAGASAGAILPRAVASWSGGGVASGGRGLDAYRMQPVQIVGPRLVAAR